MNNNISIELIIVSLFVLLLIGAGVYWAATQWGKSISQQNNPQKSLSADGSLDDTHLKDASPIDTPSVKTPPIELSPPLSALPPLRADGHRWRVLVVDDLPRWAEVVLDYSNMLPCDIRHVSSLMTAAQTLKTWKPQLILLDLHMPRDDWKPQDTLRHKYLVDQKTLAFCDQVVNSAESEETMVVIVSVEKQEVEQQKALVAGAFRFYTKESFHLGELEDLLQILQVRSSANSA